MSGRRPSATDLEVFQQCVVTTTTTTTTTKVCVT
jgi:hypothetical protein